MTKAIAILSTVILLLGTTAYAGPKWNLPQQLSDKNTTVTFEVDSTWHLVEGKTAGVHGRVWLEDQADSNSINVEVSLPVTRFDTERESRDEKLRTVMHADRYPEISFIGRGASPRSEGCDPEQMTPGDRCKLEIQGDLLISGVKKTVTLPVVVERLIDSFKVAGELSLAWADYGVEDPSIIIAKLDPKVIVRMAVELPDGAAL